MPVDIPGFAYATLVAAGGIMGYVKSSKIQMYLNIIFSNFQQKKNENPIEVFEQESFSIIKYLH